MERFVIEDAVSEDLDAIVAIEQGSFPTPWPREAFEQELSLPFGGVLVARGEGALGGSVLGYVVTWVVDAEMHILTIAVHPDHRGQGIGGALLDRAEAAATERGARRAFLEVRRSNRPAIDLYRRSGYTQIGIRRRYYSDNDEDAIVMAKVLVTEPDEALG